jgi:nitrogen fixation NifU-like protein
MPEMEYNKKVMDHFMSPRNVGLLEKPDGYGKVGSPVCGDLMEMFIKVKEERLTKLPSGPLAALWRLLPVA